MTEQDVSRSRTYQAGEWYGVVGPNVLVLLPPQEKHRVAAIWALADEGAGFDETLDALIAGGLRDLHGFVLVSASEGDTKVVVRGAATARFVVGGETVEVQGSEATTWVERSLQDVEAMVVEVAEVPDGTPSYEMEHGLVRVARLWEGTVAPTAAAPTPASHDEIGGATAGPAYSAGLVAVPSAFSTAAVDEDGDDPLAEPAAPVLEPVADPENDADEPGANEPMEELAEEPEPGDADTDTDDDTSFESSFATTPAPSEVTEPADAVTPVPEGEGGLWAPTPVEPAEPVAYSSADGADLDAPDLGPATEDHVEEDDAEDELETGVLPVVGAHAVSAEDLEPTGSFAPDDTPEDDTGESLDHDGATSFTPFESEDYELARPGIHGQEPAPAVTARPVARLVISSGETVDVDRVVVLGRSPVARRYAQDEHPLLIAVPSPHQEISSTHVEVRPGSGADHGTAVVTDLGSTNGTVVAQPGLEPEELQPGVSVQLIPGAVIDLGDGVTISVTRP